MNFVGYIIVIIIVLLVIFLICRELVCWYWKINEIRDLLQSLNEKSSSPKHDSSDEILRLLRNINSQLSEISSNTKNAKVVSNSSTAESTDKEKDKPIESVKPTTAVVEETKVPSDFTITSHLGRTLAMKEGKYYCPKCFTRISSEFSSMCSNCGKSFME